MAQPMPPLFEKLPRGGAFGVTIAYTLFRSARSVFSKGVGKTTNRLGKVLLFFFFGLVVMDSCLAVPAQISCIFDVNTPAKTPVGDGVFLIGNQPVIGDWKGSGVALSRITQRVFRFKGAFAAGSKLEFKFTRGDFARVEKSATGGELPNRVLEISGSNPVSASFTVAAWADQFSGSAEPNISGKYESLGEVSSRFLPDPHKVWVLLPPSYGKSGSRNKRFPVLYMHDGNNLFDPQTSFGGVDWGVDETVNYLANSGQIEEIIVVGIGNDKARNDEYTPFRDPKHGGGKGNLYGRFLVEELKPIIDAKFRTKPDAASTALGGSSLGGLISLYLGLRYPTVFSGIIAMSPSVWWAEGQIIPWAAAQKTDPARIRLWTDIGLNEGKEALDYCRRFDKRIKAAFPGLKRYVYKEFPLASHNEAAWRARFPQALTHLFGKQSSIPAQPGDDRKSQNAETNQKF